MVIAMKMTMMMMMMTTTAKMIMIVMMMIMTVTMMNEIVAMIVMMVLTITMTMNDFDVDNNESDNVDDVGAEIEMDPQCMLRIMHLTHKTARGFPKIIDDELAFHLRQKSRTPNRSVGKVSDMIK